MARVGREVRLQERSARARLKPRHLPYWRTISEGCHIGYYRGKRDGTWYARYREAGTAEGYVVSKLGKSDENVEADGVDVLNWKQALDKANAWISQIQNGVGRLADLKLTVQDVIEQHIVDRDARNSARVGRRVRSTASSKLTVHVLTDRKLCAIKLVNLTEAHLRDWQRRLAIVKSSSKQRVVSEIKAALNAVYEEKRRVLPPDFGVTVKFGLKPVFALAAANEEAARENQVLDDDKVRLIVRSAKAQDKDGDFAILVLLLAATGARFSQLARMRVGDVQLGLNRLMVPPSAKGRGKVKASIRVRVGDEVMDALRGYCDGRPSDMFLLERWHHRQVGPATWERTGRQPWKTPSEMLRQWHALMADIGMPGVIPYALRHSSIVRGLRVGLPIRLIAAIHDTSVAMIERHYARWITDDLDELSARAIVSLT